MDEPARRIRFETDYPEPDVVGLVTGGDGPLRKVQRGYLVADENNVVRFVPEFDRESDLEEQ